MLRDVEILARYEHTTVLIEGESGTGKSYVARHIHQSSPRSRATFHQVVLSALDDNLAASDLFGHLSGAYTDARQNRPGHFVTANKGTLFLDEIGKASRGVQRKLLHAVEHREISPVGSDRAVRLDVRLVVATNIPLRTLVERGEFLPDLAARLESFRVHIPSLRERRADIPMLVRQFAGLRAASCGHPAGAPRFHPDLMEALMRAEWPYNLRQLDGVVQRLLINAESSDEVGCQHCTGSLAGLGQSARALGIQVTPAMVAQRKVVLKKVTAVAQSLGMSRQTVYRYLKRAKLEGG